MLVKGDGAGTYWLDTAIRYILKNPIYIGTLEQLKTETKGYTVKGRIINDSYIVCEDVITPIIEKELYYQVQEINKANKRGRSKPSTNLFSTLARCGDCGSSMHYKKGRHYYVCGAYNKRHRVLSKDKHANVCSNHKTSQEDLTLKVSNELRKLAMSFDKLDELIASQNLMKLRSSYLKRRILRQS